VGLIRVQIGLEIDVADAGTDRSVQRSRVYPWKGEVFTSVQGSGMGAAWEHSKIHRLSFLGQHWTAGREDTSALVVPDEVSLTVQWVGASR
jgi:hypothetical protein